MLEEIHCECSDCIPITCPKKDWNDYPFFKALRPKLLREIPVSLKKKKKALLVSECWKLLVGNVAIKMHSLVSVRKGEFGITGVRKPPSAI